MGEVCQPWALFPPGVLVATEPVHDHDDGLFAEERRQIESAIPRRRWEFASGRRCARRLMSRLGEPPRPLLAAGNRAPSWPPGIMGSISHAGGRVAVAVARCGTIAGLGIDIGPDEALERALWDEICNPVELDRLRRSELRERARQVRLLFSAKESVFKAIHAFVTRTLGFRDLEIVLNGAEASVRLPLDVAAALPAGSRLGVVFSRDPGWILTGATLQTAGRLSSQGSSPAPAESPGISS